MFKNHNKPLIKTKTNRLSPHSWLLLVKDKELRNRILFTLLVLFVYKLGLFITVPNVKVTDLVGSLSDSSWLNLISLVGGGGLETFSILSLGVTPYITASIIIQLLSMDVIPHLTQLAKEGAKGRKKLDQYTRYMSVLFAFVQAFSIVYMINKNYAGVLQNANSFAQMAYIALVFTAGSMALVWLGDQISAHGVGNGMSLIIAAGIVGRLPQSMISSFNTLITSKSAPENGAWIFVGYIAAYLLIIVLVTLLNTAERRLPVQYTTSSLQLAKQKMNNYIPLKVNSASVIPVIFASSVMMTPLQIAGFFAKSDTLSKMKDWLGMGTWYSLIIYAVLIVLFTFFYVQMQINPEKLAENLGKAGAYIPSIRPGKETEKYVDTVLSRITVLGSFALMLIALLPHVLPLLWKDMPSSISLGGTGMIIVVGVALETAKQLTGMLIQKSYKTDSDF